jgi:hypothetical protein
MESVITLKTEDEAAESRRERDDGKGPETDLFELLEENGLLPGPSEKTAESPAGQSRHIPQLFKKATEDG